MLASYKKTLANLVNISKEKILESFLPVHSYNGRLASVKCCELYRIKPYSSVNPECVVIDELHVILGL
jgi:hypothetical protein